MMFRKHDRFWTFQPHRNLVFSAVTYGWHMTGIRLFRVNEEGVWARHLQFCAFGRGITFTIGYCRNGWALLDFFGIYDREAFIARFCASPVSAKTDEYHDEWARQREREQAG